MWRVAAWVDRRYAAYLMLGGSIFDRIYFVDIFFVFFGGLHGVGVGWVDRRDVGCLRLGGSHRGPVVPATLVPPGKSRTIVTSIGVVGHTREQHHSSVFLHSRRHPAKVSLTFFPTSVRFRGYSFRKKRQRAKRCWLVFWFSRTRLSTQWLL